MNATDSGGTDADGNISLEDGTSGYSVISAPTKTELGGTDDYALTVSMKVHMTDLKIQNHWTLT